MSTKIAGKVQDRKAMYSKTDIRYWLRDGKLRKDKRSPYFTVQIAYRGDRHSYPTGTNNKQTAARKAAEIYRHLVDHGTEATLVKYRSRQVSSGTATIGEWISAAREVARVEPPTFTQNCRALRRIAADLAKIQMGKKKFGKNGSKIRREKIDRLSLDIFARKPVDKWIKDYIKPYRHDPRRVSKAKTSCNSTLRQARSLFSQRILRNIHHLKLPNPPPFDGVDLYETQDNKYRSKIELIELMKAAQLELREREPNSFVAFLIECCSGLRRSEIDVLHWRQVDLENKKIWVELTEDGRLKTDDSRGSVPIDEHASSVLKEFKEKAEGKKFVIEPDTPEISKLPDWGKTYRAKKTWSHLISWLRSKGVEVQKPNHELRKEFGSQYAAHFGIYAASNILRHTKVSTTEAFYAHLKDKPVLQIGKMLKGIPLSKPKRA